MGRPETDIPRVLAMTELGGGLHEVKLYEDALLVDEAKLSLLKRLGRSKREMLSVRCNLARTYQLLGRRDEALVSLRAVYDDAVAAFGPDNELSLNSALNLSVDLIKAGKFREAQSILSKVIPIARQKLGAENDVTLQMRSVRAQTLFQPDDATRNEVNEAITTLEEVVPVVRRVFGKTHPKVRLFQGTLDAAKAKLEFKY